MLQAVASAWALFLGLCFIMLGNGLQGTLLGIRAVAEGFDTTVTGLVMSGYFVGFLAGSLLAPRMVRQVGHVRVFAAMASLASTAVLVHLVAVEPWTWGAMRIVTGFSYASLYVVAESWLNDRATNQTRGQMLSFYSIVVLGGMAGGQYLLNLGDPQDFLLFIVASLLISLGLIPLLLSAGPAPKIETTRGIGLFELYRHSPLGVVASFFTGMAHGTLIGMGAVYAGRIGLSVQGVAFFMSMIFIGGLAFQWPIGGASDRFDRRRVLTAVTWIASGLALAGALIGPLHPVLLFAIVVGFGGMSLPLYSLCVAYMNDYLEQDQMVAASAKLYIYVGVGATVGPTLVAILMDHLGSFAFFGFLALVHGAIGAFALWRMTQREALPLSEQGPSVSVTSSAGTGATTFSVDAVRDQMDRDLAQMSRHAMRRR